tara:strand:+ start:1018 stop:2583 length:1566 start_codon:yes stop_codon:yes gene_type:complete
MNRFVFVTLPSVELERPPAAAGALAPIIKKAGLEPVIKDFTLYLFNNVSNHIIQKLEKYWRGKSDTLDEESRNTLDEYLDIFIKDILSNKPTWIGISVFSRFSVTAANEFLHALKHRSNFRGKVVVGGQGISSELNAMSKNGIGIKQSFAELALQDKLCDYFIQGDSEESLYALLTGNTQHPGINGVLPPQQIIDLDALPMNDYSLIPPTSYYPSHVPGVYITASRGCVRKCSFCNVPDLWPKFKMRSPENIVAEIKHNADQGAQVFQFTDSLINGDLKKWRKINHQLAELRKEEKYKDIKYFGQFICRPKAQQTEEDWYWYAQGGADAVVVGFESFSKRVRTSMGKYYDNEDIDFHFEQCAKYGIKTIALMFVGYPNENQEDHEMNLEFLYRYKKYADAGIIHMIRWGYTGMFFKAQKINDNEIDIILDPHFEEKFSSLPLSLRDVALGFSWVNRKNPTLTLNERMRRRLELHKLSVDLGWPQTRSEEELTLLIAIMKHLTNVNTVGDLSYLDELKDLHD